MPASAVLPPLIVRADATPEIGGGHLMRCLALALAWRDQGGAAEFVGRYDEGFPAVLAAANMPVTPITHVHPDPSDATQTKARIGAAVGAMPPLVVVDGYHFDASYQRSIRGTGGTRVLRVDDSERTSQTYADILLNPNVHAADIPYECPPEVVVLAGTRYSLLRKEFRELLQEHEVPRTAKRVLVTMGSSDPAGASALVLGALERLSDTDLEVDLVVGPGNPRRAKLEALSSRFGQRVRLRSTPSDMAAVMRQVDLAVAAAGSTAWELAAMGVPMLLTATAPNQVPIARELHRRGAAVDLGPVETLTRDRVADAIRDISLDADRRRRLVSHARQLVDGCGVDRVITVCRELSRTGPFDWTIRLASTEDVFQIWRIANDPEVRANSFSRQPIPIADHMRWFSSQVAASEVRWWIADLAGVVAGHVRYACLQGDVAEVHFSVAAPFRGRGVAAGLLSLTFPHACTELGVRSIRGVALATNTASSRVFENAGYSRAASVEDGEQAVLRFERLRQ